LPKVQLTRLLVNDEPFETPVQVGELRELTLSGLIRPEDIARDNSILHTQIAEARISYGGRGQLTQAQQARWGQQIYDALFPF
jgi:flagellar L-ring protein precursor FlgH